MRTVTVAGLTLCFLYAGTRPAAAYIDPGSTNMALQWLVGGAAASVVLVAGLWRRATGRLRGLFRTDRPAQPLRGAVDAD